MIPKTPHSNPARRSMYKYLIPLLAAFLPNTLLLGQHGPEIPDIESAQRALQERYTRFYEIAGDMGMDVSGIDPHLTFPDRVHDGRNPGLFPEDCFYEKDIVDEETGAVDTDRIVFLIGDLANQLVTDWSMWLHPSWHGRMEGKGAPNGKTAVLSPPVYPDTTIHAGNYLEFFDVVTSKLNQMVAIQFQVDTTDADGDPNGTPWYRIGEDSGPDCIEAMEGALTNFHSDTATPVEQPGLIVNPEQMQYSVYDADEDAYETLVYATEGSFIVEHPSFQGSARVYGRLYDTAEVNHGRRSTRDLPSDAPHDEYDEWFLVDGFSMEEGGTYVSSPFAAHEDQSFQLPCPTQSGFDNGEFLGWGIAGRLIVTPEFKHHPSSALIACADPCRKCRGVAGTCSELRFGSLDFRMGLGKSAEGEIGSLQLSTQTIDPLSASPLGLKIHRNHEGAKVLRDGEYANGLRQVVSDQTLVDVEIIDPYRKYAVRHYTIEDAGTVEDGFYQPDPDDAFKTVIVDNPQPPQYRASATTDFNNNDVFFLNSPGHGIPAGTLFNALIDSTGPVLPEFLRNGQLTRGEVYVLYAYDSDRLTMMWWDPANEWWDFDQMIEADDSETLLVQSPQPFGRLNITESTRTRTRTMEYSSLAGTPAANNTITLSDVMDNKQRSHTRERLFDAENPNLFTDTVTETDGNGGVISKVEKHYRVFPWNHLGLPTQRQQAELIREVRDPDGEALTAKFDYYDDPESDGAGFGRLKSVQYPDGSWEAYEYDPEGRTSRVFRPFRDSGLSLDPAGNRVETITRESVDDLEGSGSGGVVITRVEAIDGQEVARRYQLHWSEPIDGLARQATVEAASKGAPWSDPNNLRTDRWTFAEGSFSGKVAKVKERDGTMAFHTYSANPETGQKTTAIRRGVPNETEDDVVEGTETVTVVNARGGRVSRVVSDVESGIVLVSSVTMPGDFDELGRPLVTLFHDGTFETRAYEDCCGIVTITDRTGATRTEYTEMDGTLTAVEANGITTNHRESYESDGVKGVIGFTRSTVVNGRDSAGSVTSGIETFDPAGRLIASLDPRDGVNRLTRYRESLEANGQHVRTTVQPNDAERVEVFHRDGSPRSQSFDGRERTRFEYGVESDTHEVFDGTAFVSQSFNARTVKEIRVGINGEEAEWEKRYRDMLGRVYRVEVPDGDGNAVGNSTLTYYDTRGLPRKEVDPDGVTTLFQHDDRGRLEYSVLDISRNDQIDFGGRDRITEFSRAVVNDADRGDVVRTEKRVWKTDGADAGTLVSTTDRSTDGLNVWTDSHGESVHKETVYGGDGTVIQQKTMPDGTVHASTSVNGFVTSETVTHPVEGVLSDLSHRPDDFDRRESTTDNLLGGTTTFEYYDSGQLRKITTPESAPGEGDAQTTEFFYDVMDQLVSTRLPNNETSERRYHPDGSLKRVFGENTIPVDYTYDRQGRKHTMTTWQEFDSAAPDGTGVGGEAVTTWTYNPLGLLSSKTDAAGEEVRYTYTSAGRLRSRDWARLGVDETSPVRTVYGYGEGGADDTRVIDGNLRGVFYQNDPAETPEVRFTYNRLGRTATIEDASGKREMVYEDDSLKRESYLPEVPGLFSGLTVERGRDGRNRLDRISVELNDSLLYEAGYGYDDASRLESAQFKGHEVTYNHFPDAEVRQALTYYNGESSVLSVSRRFDNLHRLTARESIVSDGPSYRYTYRYNDLNRRERVILDNDHYWRFGYDSLGQVESGVKFTSDGTALDGYAYGYTFDHIGNRTQTAVNGRESGYIPNLLNQYETRDVPRMVDVRGLADPDAVVSVEGETAIRQGDLFHGILDLGTRVDADDPQWAEFAVTGTLPGGGHDDADRISEVRETAYLPANPEPFKHDADGNLVQDGRWKYTWNAENRLIQMETLPAAVTAGAPHLRLEFLYDAQGRRVRKTVQENAGNDWTTLKDRLFVYQDWNLLAELEAEPLTVGQSYLWGLDLSDTLQGAGGVGGLLMIAHQEEIHYPVYDGNGNIMALINAATATESARYEYAPFGEPLRTTGPMAEKNPFRFSTKYTDTETDLLYYGYRYLNPQTGRWLNRDPIEEEGGVNLYGFVGNCPVCRSDLLGLREWCAEDCEFLRDLLQDAFLARAAYGDEEVDGFESGITWEDKSTGLRAREFIAHNGDTRVVAFAGTDAGDLTGDWRGNARQNLGAHSEHYRMAIERVAVQSEASKFVGHSLGGGLAHASSLATRSDAITFNAAALDRNTQDQYRIGRRESTNVINIHTRSDGLTDFQSSRVRRGSLSSGEDIRIPDPRNRKMHPHVSDLKVGPFPIPVPLESRRGFQLRMHPMDAVIQSIKGLIDKHCE